MKNIVICINKRDTDLLGLLNDIGTNNFCKIVRMSLRTLVDPSEYDDRKLKKILSTKGKYNISPPIEILIRIQAQKDANLEKLLDNLKDDTKISYFAKVAVRNFLGAYLYPYFFKNKQEFFDLDKRVIPILKSAKIKSGIKIVEVNKQVTPAKPIEKPKEVEKEKTKYEPPLEIESTVPDLKMDLNSSNDDDDFDALSMLEQLLD